MTRTTPQPAVSDGQTAPRTARRGGDARARGPASERAPWNAGCTLLVGTTPPRLRPRRLRPANSRKHRCQIHSRRIAGVRGAMRRRRAGRRAAGSGHAAGTERARSFKLPRRSPLRREQSARPDHKPEPVRPRRRAPRGGGSMQTNSRSGADRAQNNGAHTQSDGAQCGAHLRRASFVRARAG